MSNTWQAQPATQPLRGELRVPSDKSISHRAVMLSSLAPGDSHIKQPLLGADVRSSIAAMTAFGATIVEQAGDLTITGTKELASPTQALDCGNAGTLMRLLAGLVCGRGVSCVLDGDASLRQRPMRRITDPLGQMGAQITSTETGTPPLAIAAVSELARIEYTLPVASAQIKSAILLAGLTSPHGAKVIEPVPCRDHTELILPVFGAEIQRTGAVIEVAGCAHLQPADITVPADISSAAFYLVAASIVPGSDLLLREVCVNPTRNGIITLLQKMGANIELVEQRELGKEQVADLRVRYAELHGIEITAADVPLAIDELPVLFIAASNATGQTKLRGAAELRAKETDRLTAMAAVLTTLGIDHTEHLDGIDISGGTLGSGTVDSCGDHRIAMASAVAALGARDTVTITDTANVATSFPRFVELAASCGWQIASA